MSTYKTCIRCKGKFSVKLKNQSTCPDCLSLLRGQGKSNNNKTVKDYNLEIKLIKANAAKNKGLEHVKNTSIVYFIIIRANGLLNKDIVKIGYTSGSVESRWQGLLTGSPFNTREFYTMRGSREYENKVQKAFSKDQIAREWFYLSQEIVDFIAEFAALYSL